MGCEDTNTTSGLYKDIKLYQSLALGDYCENTYNDRYRALKNAKTYIEGAFDQTGHYVGVDYETDEPYIKDQCWNPDSTFEQAYPCDPNFTIEYNSPKEYFKDWIECGDKPTASDQTILLTNCDARSGGIGGDIAFTQTGQNVAELPTSYQTDGSSAAFDAMATVLHEIGHHCMKNGECGNTDYSEHHFGRLGEYGWWDHYETPMGKWNKISPSENACCQDHVEQNKKYWKMTWSDCALAIWEC